MHFDDDNAYDAVPESGESLVVETGSGTFDLGPATYDSDGDGLADSVVLVEEGTTYVVTDLDGDNVADQIEVVEDSVATYDSPDDGGAVEVGYTGSEYGDDAGSGFANVDPYSGESYPGSGAEGWQDGGGQDVPGGDSGLPPAGDDLVVELDGQAYQVGQADQDINSDGIADSVVVTYEDGQQVVYTDIDGDGTVDQAAALNTDGSVQVVAQDDASGEWSTVATGEVTEDGLYLDNEIPSDSMVAGGGTGAVQTDYESGDSMVLEYNGETADLGTPTVDFDGDGTIDTVVQEMEDGSVLAFTDVDGDGDADQVIAVDPTGGVQVIGSDGQGGWEPVATGHITPEGEFVVDSTTGSTGFAAPEEPGAEPVDYPTTGSAGGYGEGIILEHGGQATDLGAPTVDFDGDGTPDTVVTQQEDGSIVGFRDVDGDGDVDQIIQVGRDGSVLVAEEDGQGGWTQTASGQIGPDGQVTMNQ